MASRPRIATLLPWLLRNDGGNARNGLGVRLVGRQSHRDGVGVRVRATAGGRVQFSERRAGRYLVMEEGGAPR